MSETAIIIACHSSSMTKINTLKYNIARFKELSTKMFIVNSEEYRGVLEKHIHGINVNYMENDDLLCHGKWARMIPKLVNKHDDFILTNDSFCIVNSLDRFYKTYNSARFDHHKNEMVSIIDSREQLPDTKDITWELEKEVHYPDFLRWYSKTGVWKWLSHYHEYKDKCNNTLELIKHLEIGSGEVFENRDAAYRVPEDYRVNLHFDSSMMNEWIGKKKYPIVKLKYLTTLEPDYYVPDDFDSKSNKQLNADLAHLDDSGARLHFHHHGLREGRAYKSSQRPKSLPHVIDKLIPDDVI